MNSDEQMLRPEARPLPFHDLDEKQREGFQRIISLLRDAAEAVHPGGRIGGQSGNQVPPSISTGPFVEQYRSSRNVLVSGGRGTGKTTLLLSLTEALRHGGGAEFQDYPTDHGDGIIVESLDMLRNRLVWLETLDMEPLSDSVNLLGAVLARIEKAVDAYFPVPDETEKPSLLHPGAGYHAVQRDLLRLQTSVALTFGGNVARRGGSLDPDTFAVEVRRTERERLGLNARFAEVLGMLSGVLAEGSLLRAPLFVLPVDDLDLNPAAAVQLLELLRAVQSPYLLVLIAADHELLSTILKLRYEGELSRIAAPVALSDADRLQASDLAVNALRKHLPAAQRVILTAMSPHEALEFHPPGSTVQLRTRIELPPFAADDALLIGFSDPGLDSEAREMGRTVLSWRASGSISANEPWAEILRMPVRQLTDLAFAVARRTWSVAQNDLTQPIVDLATDRIAELQSRAGRGSPSDPNGEVAIEGQLQWQPELADVRLPGRGDETGTRPQLWSAVLSGWSARSGANSLSSIESALYAGALDVVGDRLPGEVRSRVYVQSMRETRFADHPHAFRWPWLTHSRAWAYHHAITLHELARTLWTDRPNAAFGAWIASVTAQLLDILDGPSMAQQEIADSWEALDVQLAGLPRARPPVDAWLVQVAMLCTPEMGFMPQQVTTSDDESEAGLGDGPVASGPKPPPEDLAARAAAGRVSRRSDLPPGLRDIVPEPAGESPPHEASPAERPGSSRRTSARKAAKKVPAKSTTRQRRTPT